MYMNLGEYGQTVSFNVRARMSLKVSHYKLMYILCKILPIKRFREIYLLITDVHNKGMTVDLLFTAMLDLPHFPHYPLPPPPQVDF